LGFAYFFRKAAPNSTDGFDIAADMVRFEIEFDKEDVGPPIRMVTLFRDRAPDERLLPK
jgi:hypothetical protein